MGVAITYKSALDITETFDTDETNGGKTTTPFNTSLNLHGTSSPTVTEGGFCSQALSAGAATVDLTSVTTARGRAMTFNALKIRAFRAWNPATNTGSITIMKGASNGYTGFGSAFSITLKPGQEFNFYDYGAGTAVSSTVKTLDLTGTGTESLKFAIAGGA